MEAGHFCASEAVSISLLHFRISLSRSSRTQFHICSDEHMNRQPSRCHGRPSATARLQPHVQHGVERIVPEIPTSRAAFGSFPHGLGQARFRWSHDSSRRTKPRDNALNCCPCKQKKSLLRQRAQSWTACNILRSCSSKMSLPTGGGGILKRAFSTTRRMLYMQYDWLPHFCGST
jgi:hypothetical protein